MKIVILIITAILMMFLTACGFNNVNENSDASQVSTSEVASEDTSDKSTSDSSSKESSLSDSNDSKTDSKATQSLASETEKQPKQTEETAKESSNAQNLVKPSTAYKEYFNDRYLYSIEYPSNFIMQAAPANNDGRCFLSPDKRAELLVYGSNNVLAETVETSYQQTLSEHSNASYKLKKDNWYIVSWVEGDAIAYQKTVVGEGSINTFIVKYPQVQNDIYDVILNHIIKSFETPAIDEVH